MTTFPTHVVDRQRARLAGSTRRLGRRHVLCIVTGGYECVARFAGDVRYHLEGRHHSATSRGTIFRRAWRDERVDVVFADADGGNVLLPDATDRRAGGLPTLLSMGACGGELQPDLLHRFVALLRSITLVETPEYRRCVSLFLFAHDQGSCASIKRHLSRFLAASPFHATKLCRQSTPRAESVQEIAANFVTATFGRHRKRHTPAASASASSRYIHAVKAAARARTAAS